MPTAKKQNVKSKSAVKVQDLRSKRNPKGGAPTAVESSNKVTPTGLLLPAIQKVRG